MLLNFYTASKTRSMIFGAQQRSMESKAQLMVTALLQNDDFSQQQIFRTVSSLEDISTTRTVVTDASGRALYDSLEIGNAEGKLVLFPELVGALSGDDIFFCRYVDNAIQSRAAMPLMRNGEVFGAVYLMEYDEDQGAIITTLQTNILRISVALEICIVLLAFSFSMAFSRRMRRILHSVRSMRDGNYETKVLLNGHDELTRLGREFNDLADRLKESEQSRRQFVSDASHELKTPLASIKLLSDSILQNEMDEQTQREFIGDIGREADRLGRLTQKLLTLTKLDNEAEEGREIIDAAVTVRKVTRMLRPLARLRNIRVDENLEMGCSVMLVVDDLYQIAFNLTENAIKYNRENGWVGVTLKRRDDMVELCVADNGVGIPSDALDHIFDRFYRVDKARSRAAGGSGLGLSIVHDMVRRNFGEVSVKARAEGGTAFTVTFPLWDREEVEE